jgi:hypothetical protein
MHIPCHDVVVATLNFLLTHIAYMYVDDHKVHTLVFRSLKRTHDMFIVDQGVPPSKDEKG